VQRDVRISENRLAKDCLLSITLGGLEDDR
jgi:hypothetical protein